LAAKLTGRLPLFSTTSGRHSIEGTVALLLLPLVGIDPFGDYKPDFDRLGHAVCLLGVRWRVPVEAESYQLLPDKER
jgi:hypothetical protein